MTVPTRIELESRVRFDECGADGRLRDSGLLRYAQEAAWVHSEAAGFDRRWYLERGLTWLVRGVELMISEAIEHGVTLTVSTEVGGWRRVWAQRCSEFTDRSGALQAAAAIDWVLLGPKGSPIRVPEAIVKVFSDLEVPSSHTVVPMRVRLGDPPETAVRRAITVRRRDLDPMAHMNNAIYLDDAEEAIVAGGGEAATSTIPRVWTMEFVRPAGPQEMLTSVAWPDARGWSYRLVADSGEELFRAHLNVQS